MKVKRTRRYNRSDTTAPVHMNQRNRRNEWKERFDGIKCKRKEGRNFRKTKNECRLKKFEKNGYGTSDLSPRAGR